MSIATIDATQFGSQIRSAVAALLARKAGPVLLPPELTLRVRNDGGSVVITWDEHVEADLPGVNPDLLRARCFPDHAIVDLRISNLRINY